MPRRAAAPPAKGAAAPGYTLTSRSRRCLLIWLKGAVNQEPKWVGTDAATIRTGLVRQAAANSLTLAAPARKRPGKLLPHLLETVAQIEAELVTPNPRTGLAVTRNPGTPPPCRPARGRDGRTRVGRRGVGDRHHACGSGPAEGGSAARGSLFATCLSDAVPGGWRRCASWSRLRGISLAQTSAGRCTPTPVIATGPVRVRSFVTAFAGYKAWWPLPVLVGSVRHQHHDRLR